jgi:hypothetical protein
MRRIATIFITLLLAVSTWWHSDLGVAHAATPPSALVNIGPRAVCVQTCRAWRPVDTWAPKPVPAYLTSFVPFAGAPAIVVNAGWFRTADTDLALYLGYEGPGTTTLPRGPEAVPTSGLSRLLATFNSGFYEKDGAAGFYVNHTLYYPMIRGLATVVRYTNGTVDVAPWTGGARPGANVEMARQNLKMLVYSSRATGLSAVNVDWGLTLHGVAAVWRSALGIDARGNLIYAAAPDVTSAQLARIMVDLHCVRAMQLDINPEWPILVTYGASGARLPTLDVANPNQVATRFLSVTTKDFFAVYISHHPGEAQPW